MTETIIRPGDLAAPPAAPERLDLETIRPGHPAWTTEAETLLRLGGYVPDDPDVRAAREALVSRALAEGWSLRALGRAILTERAAASEALGPITTAHAIGDDQLAAGYALGDPPADRLWARVTRPARQGEVTNATRGTF
jgi:hypothetical protein